MFKTIFSFVWGIFTALEFFYMRIPFLCFALFTAQLCKAQQTTLDSTICVKVIPSNTVKAYKSNFKVNSLLIPVTLITYGLIAQGNNGLAKLDNSTRNSIVSNHSGYKTKIDNYLQFSPALAVYGLNIIGIKGKNNLRDRTIIYAISTIISVAVIKPIKYSTDVPRPNGLGYNSFPSGHTTTAFAAAEFLMQEYKAVSPWYGVAGYAVAATTAALRVYNNRHWVSDVVAGAGFGILSTKLAYWVYPFIKKKLFKTRPASAIILPYYQPGSACGLALVYNFKK
jgi:PAP2 superfamily